MGRAVGAVIGIDGYFIDRDAWGSPVVWAGTGFDDPDCQPVIEGGRLQRHHPDLWAAIERLVDGRTEESGELCSECREPLPRHEEDCSAAEETP